MTDNRRRKTGPDPKGGRPQGEDQAPLEVRPQGEGRVQREDPPGTEGPSRGGEARHEDDRDLEAGPVEAALPAGCQLPPAAGPGAGGPGRRHAAQRPAHAHRGHARREDHRRPPAPAGGPEAGLGRRCRSSVRYDLAGDESAIERRMIEANLHRRQLDALDRVRLARRMLEIEERREPGGLSQYDEQDLRDRIGEALGMSGRNVQRYLNILNAPMEVQRAHSEGGCR